MHLQNTTIGTHKQDAVGNGRRRPRCRHLANSTKHTTVFDSGPFHHLYVNTTCMSSSTKTKVHNVSHCRQRKIEPRSQLTMSCTDNFVKFGRFLSRPNKVGLKCPSVCIRTSVRPQKVSSISIKFGTQEEVDELCTMVCSVTRSKVKVKVTSP